MPMLRSRLLVPLVSVALGCLHTGCFINRGDLSGDQGDPDASLENVDAPARPDADRDAYVPPGADANVCGDGVRSGAETCDDGDTTGGDGCSAACTMEPGFDCASGDCVARCGDALVVGGETCDDGNASPNVGCSATCTIDPGFVCTGAPSMCARTCGNGVLDMGETCDDRRPESGDGCSASCAIEAGFLCMGAPSVCTVRCGDGVVAPSEACDDSNVDNGDGCSTVCGVETGYACTGAPSTCGPDCGDGLIIGSEVCDDGFTHAGDGCSPTCTVESGASCVTIMGTSQCSRSFTYDPSDVRIPASGDRGNIVVNFDGMVPCTATRVRFVSLNMRHSAMGDLVVSITNPFGESVVLTDRIGGNWNVDGNYAFYSNADAPLFPGPSDPIAPGAFNTVNAMGSRTLVLQTFRGGSGAWSLAIDDQETMDTGTLRALTIAVYCSPSS